MENYSKKIICKKLTLSVCYTKFLKNLGLLACILFVFGCATNKSNSINEMQSLLKTHTLVLAYDDGHTKMYDERGLKPLFKHLESEDFKNTYVFDRTTGKASAFILVYGGAKKLYTGVLSKEAIPVLEKYNIEYSADKVVDYIVNQTGDGKCPMEKSVAEINDPVEAYTILKERFGK